jgi:hypothetical protein
MRHDHHTPEIEISEENGRRKRGPFLEAADQGRRRDAGLSRTPPAEMAVACVRSDVPKPQAEVVGDGAASVQPSSQSDASRPTARARA